MVKVYDRQSNPISLNPKPTWTTLRTAPAAAQIFDFLSSWHEEGREKQPLLAPNCILANRGGPVEIYS